MTAWKALVRRASAASSEPWTGRGLWPFIQSRREILGAAAGNRTKCRRGGARNTRHLLREERIACSPPCMHGPTLTTGSPLELSSRAPVECWLKDVWRRNGASRLPHQPRDAWSEEDFCTFSRTLVHHGRVALPDELEAKLIARLVARDERAFNGWCRRTGAGCLRSCSACSGTRPRRRTSPRVFVQVFKAISTFRGESKLSTWIYRIAVNLCKNRSSTSRVRHAGEQDELEAVAERTDLGDARRANVAVIERPGRGPSAASGSKDRPGRDPEDRSTFRGASSSVTWRARLQGDRSRSAGSAAGTVKSRIFRARPAQRDGGARAG